MDELGNLRDACLEEAEGIGVRHHHSGNLSTLFSNDALQVVEVDGTVSQRLHLDNLQATYCGRGRISAVGAVGHNNLLAHFAARTMVIVDGHQASQLAVGSCIRLEGEVSEAGQFAKRPFQERHESQGSLRCAGRLFGMQTLELRQSCHLFVNLRIVLHGAGA